MEDRAYKLRSGSMSEYRRYVKSHRGSAAGPLHPRDRHVGALSPIDLADPLSDTRPYCRSAHLIPLSPYRFSVDTTRADNPNCTITSSWYKPSLPLYQHTLHRQARSEGQQHAVVAR